MKVPSWKIRGGVLSAAEGALVMGIVNVTPDSFSDGGRYLDPAVAIDHGLALLAEGADILDVGGESTRPGAAAVSAEEELDRVIPVIRALSESGAVVSVDTSKASVAVAAVEAGAAIINDVTGLGDPAMAGVASETGAGLVVMHMLGTPRTMQEDPRYDDVVGEVAAYLVARAEAAERAGVDRGAIAIDPGFGFGKTTDHNLELLANLDVLCATAYPVLVGTSRKSFLGSLTGKPVDARDVATAVTVALAVASGAFVVRVHNVPAAQDARHIAGAMVRGHQNDGTPPWQRD